MVLFYYSKIMDVIKKHKKNQKILFLGITFKENVNDLRNSKYYELLKKISKSKKCYFYDPHVDVARFENIAKFNINSKIKFQTIILAVNHIKILDYLKNNLNKILVKNGNFIDFNKNFKIKTKNNKFNYISLWKKIFLKINLF